MFRNMEYIYSVYKMGSFSAAAKNLYISQPCLSAMVKKTEQQLGVPIFDRKSKPLQLTEYGVKYIEYLEKIRDLEQEFENYMYDVRGLRTGHLSIGANNVFSSFVIPHLISRFNKIYPQVQVKMSEGNIRYLEQALAQGNLDIVIDNCPMDTEIFQQHQLATEHLLAAVPKAIHDAEGLKEYCMSHADIIAGRHLTEDAPALDVEAFADVPFIALHHGNDTRIRMDCICEKAGVSPLIKMETDQLATAYNITCNGLGLTLVSDTLLNNLPPAADICYYKLCSDQTHRGIYLYHKRARYVTKAMSAFIDNAVSALAGGVSAL